MSFPTTDLRVAWMKDMLSSMMLTQPDPTLFFKWNTRIQWSQEPKRDSSVNFHPDILLFSVFEGHYIIYKLFQYYLCMLNIQHGLASLPQTADLCYVTVPQSKQLAWKGGEREAIRYPFKNILLSQSITEK